MSNLSKSAETPQHAFLSASSAERWINCPGSARLAALYPERRTPSTEEGRLAHAVAEILISGTVGDLTDVERDAELEKLKPSVDQFYADNPLMPGSFQGMCKILEPYADYVAEEFAAIRATDRAAVIMTEKRVDFSRFVPEGFGTSDVIIVGEDCLEVIDLKYGKGVPVSAVDNPQIRLYALGALNEFDAVYEVTPNTKVKMVIYQPRLDSVTEEEMLANTLVEWADTIVRPAAEKAVRPDACFNPDGPWCRAHFCPAAGRCRARAEYVLDIGEWAVKDPALLTDSEMSEVLRRLEPLQDFAKKAERYAIDSILAGHQIPGWKVVEGRPTRKYTDEAQVADAVKAAGYNEALIYERSLLGITKMSSLLGKKEFKSIIEDAGLITRAPGAPKLAAEDDPRGTFNPAAADFID